MKTKEEAEKFFNFIRKLTEDNFYGKLILSFEKGMVVNIRREENIKPFDLIA